MNEKVSQRSQFNDDSILGGCSVQIQRTWTLEREARAIGFTWDRVHNIINNIRAETEEVHAVIEHENSDPVRLHDEVGDLYMAVLCLCFYLQLNPEDVLHQANEKFYKRFEQMKKNMLENGIDNLTAFSTAQKLELWQKAKRDITGAAGED